MLTAPCPALSALFPFPVAARRAVALPRPEDIHPEEWAAVASAASARRQADFLMGRACAQACLLDLGQPAVPIPMGSAGSPGWPPGLRGSITHAEGFCAAVATVEDTGLGIDVELWEGVDPDLAGHILGEQERRAHEAAEGGRIDPLALALAFAAKEAFYKAQWPRTRCYLGFEAVSVTAAGTAFTITLEESVPGLGKAGRTFSGRHALLGRHILAGIAI
jgi:4'-phosphopantetheinyl transferase EntD